MLTGNYKYIHTEVVENKVDGGWFVKVYYEAEIKDHGGAKWIPTHLELGDGCNLRGAERLANRIRFANDPMKYAEAVQLKEMDNWAEPGTYEE